MSNMALLLSFYASAASGTSCRADKNIPATMKYIDIENAPYR